MQKNIAKFSEYQRYHKDKMLELKKIIQMDYIIKARYVVRHLEKNQSHLLW